jgi:hypothetical protein
LPKQTVRNIEGALMAHLGMRVSHKKISVATSDVSGRSAHDDAGITTADSPPPADRWFE